MNEIVPLEKAAEAYSKMLKNGAASDWSLKPHGKIIPTANSYSMQQLIPNAELIVYPDSSHGLVLSVPRTLRRTSQSVPDVEK